jgi:hypothetical protein
MNTRAEALAKRIEEGAYALELLAEGLSDEEWGKVVPPDGRTAGVMIHHVASVYPIEIHLASLVAAGKPVEGVTWDVVADMNAKHAQQNENAGRQCTIDLLRQNSFAAAEVVRAFTDEQLDRAAPVSLNGGATLTAQFLIEDHAVRHSWHHMAKIKAALNGH